MKILSITDQNRRDFNAEIQCEGCNAIDYLKRGYDSRNYHDNVIPNIKCSSCGKSRNDLGIKGEYTQTKYAEHEVI